MGGPWLPKTTIHSTQTLPSRLKDDERFHPTEKDRYGFPALDYEKVFALAKELSDAFYARAVGLGIHSIIEHTGLINEHLQILREARAAGLQPENINVHGSIRFPMPSVRAAYLGEKFACIFVHSGDLRGLRANGPQGDRFSEAEDGLNVHICSEEIFIATYCLSFLGVWGFWIRLKLARLFGAHRHDTKCSHHRD